MRAVRVNKIKSETDTVVGSPRLALSPLSYTDSGFILENDIQIGNTPEHHAGMIYVQDPGAMATVNALDIESGWWVADLCAAPGGKSTQLAEKIGPSGFLLANEFVPKRAKILVSNLERLGVTNALVTSLDTGELPAMFPEVFDLVLTDAPCSGEGMLRKYDAASEEWSEENVALSAKRQSEILDNAARLVRRGGYLLYSTCTYSEEENEEQITRFLDRHGDFEIIPVREKLVGVTSDGLAGDGRPEAIKHTRRFYPHKSRGEGQYIALMRRAGDGERGKIAFRDCARALPRDKASAVEAFFKDSLTDIPRGRLAEVGENLVLITHPSPIPRHSVFMSGILVGEVRHGILHPSHQLASALGRCFKRQVELSGSEELYKKYLGGEEIPDPQGIDNGWCAILFCGAPLGLGKISGGVIKNHYPKGLRTKNTV